LYASAQLQENCNKTGKKQICGFCFIAGVRTTAIKLAAFKLQCIAVAPIQVCTVCNLSFFAAFAANKRACLLQLLLVSLFSQHIYAGISPWLFRNSQCIRSRKTPVK